MGDGVIFAGVLTKGLLMTLPEACFLMSNVSKGDGSPVLVEQAGEHAKRGELWNRLRKMRLSGRRFYIYATEEALKAALARHQKLFARAYRP